MADADAENWLKDLLGPEVDTALAFSSADEVVDYQAIAIELVRDIIDERFKATLIDMPKYSIYVTWFSKTLRNFKALVSTSIPDGAYYEVTFDGRNGIAYVDCYKKFDQRTIPVPAEPRNKELYKNYPK